MAIKELLSQGGHEEGGEEEEEGISNEPLFMFRDLRQEVTVLAQLSHPNIVALLGVSIRPMCIVLEFAPMGSLFGVLEKKVEQLKEKQVDSASTILRMPGGVLGHVMTTKIAMQVCGVCVCVCVCGVCVLCVWCVWCVCVCVCVMGGG